jgi:DNA-binding NarL/FixJ family response regulator
VLQVLVGGFGEVARRGLRAILSSPDVVIDECTAEAVMSAVGATQPDALVMDAGARDLSHAARVAAAYPALTVVACSANEDTMWTFPRFGGGRSVSQPLSAAALLESVRS